jgi:hypothetical protein
VELLRWNDHVTLVRIERQRLLTFGEAKVT